MDMSPQLGGHLKVASFRHSWPIFIFISLIKKDGDDFSTVFQQSILDGFWVSVIFENECKSILERNIDFLEVFPRGYIDEEGIYFYQGRKSKEPDISSELLKRVVKILCQKVNIKDDLHVYFGVDTNSSPNRKGKLPPSKRFGQNFRDH